MEPMACIENMDTNRINEDTGNNRQTTQTCKWCNSTKTKLKMLGTATTYDEIVEEAKTLG